MQPLRQLTVSFVGELVVNVFDVLTELGTDLFTEGEDGSNRESYNKYATQLNPDDGILYEMWENHYKGISDANIAMQKIRDSQDLLESVKIQSYAEMQFIRAYLYFDLVQQFWAYSFGHGR